MRDYGLFGLWQGVAVYYSFTFSQELAAIATFFITVKLVLEFNSEQDAVKFVTTLIGAALGVFGTDLLSRYLADGLYQKRKAKPPSQTTPERHKSRSVNFSKAAAAAVGGVGENGGGRGALRKTSKISPSDITSVDNSSDLFRSSSSSMSALDREVARLRTRASLADTERRRYKEERKWALSQGNLALATQLAWEVKRYKTLMQSFHREADVLVIRGQSANYFRCVWPYFICIIAQHQTLAGIERMDNRRRLPIVMPNPMVPHNQVHLQIPTVPRPRIRGKSQGLRRNRLPVLDGPFRSPSYEDILTDCVTSENMRTRLTPPRRLALCSRPPVTTAHRLCTMEIASSQR
jgi:hypothetical protein